jgi:hypothetical protein
MVIALVALASSLASGAVAATLITGDDIAKKAIAKKHIKKNAVVSKKVKNGSLLSKDFKAGQLLAGAPGPQGIQGIQGEKGDPGTNGIEGTDGTDGVDGADGADGADGQDGGTGAPGEPGSAVAYARVEADGTLDTAHSKNVTSSARANNPPDTPVDGVYCLELAVVAENAVVSLPRVGGNPIGITGHAGLPNNGDSTTSWCPEPTDKSVVVFIFGPSGLIAHPFYLVFN